MLLSARREYRSWHVLVSVPETRRQTGLETQFSREIVDRKAIMSFSGNKMAFDRMSRARMTLTDARSLHIWPILANLVRGDRWHNDEGFALLPDN